MARETHKPYVPIVVSRDKDGDYYCDGTGDQTEINSAITSLSSGGIVYLKQGTYNLSGAITMDNPGVILMGSGVKTVLYKATNFNANMINVTANNTEVRDLKVDGNRTVMLSDNQGVSVSNTSLVKLDQLFVTDIMHHGINTPSSSNVIISRCYSQNTGSPSVVGADGVGIIAGDNAENIKIIDCTTSNTGYHGIQVYTDTRRAFISNCHVTNPGQTLSTGDALKINPDCDDIHVTNSYFGSGPNNGLLTATDGPGPIRGLLVENSTFEGFDNTGIRLDGPTDVVIKGNNIRNNGVTASASVDYGIRINIGNSSVVANHIQVTGNNIYDNQNTPTQARPIGVYGSNTTNVQIQDNDFYGHVTSNAVFVDSGVMPPFIRNNRGHTSENSGTATITSGASITNVTHGLSATPTIHNITVTPTNNLGSANKFWISTPTSTQFRIHTDADPGASHASFAWIAVDL
jgi:hypothetical protein